MAPTIIATIPVASKESLVAAPVGEGAAPAEEADPDGRAELAAEALGFRQLMFN
jgi:hypothetical protein